MTDTPDAPRGPAASGRSQPTEMPELPGVTHAFVTLSTGLRMHVAEAGDPDAPAVLLLHGFPQHWWEWRKVIQPLAERYRVVAPDLRGAGRTRRPTGTPWTRFSRRARPARRPRAQAGRAGRPRP